MIYLNHAGTSWPKPLSVREAVASALEADPSETTALVETARGDVCRYLGIDDPERFLFTTGCTAALDVALSDLPWEPGDVVITSALEHHALVRPIENLVRLRGVRHLVAPYRPGDPIDREWLRARLDEGGVRLIATTHASNVTGELLPVADLVREAHRHDALVLLDAAQTVGVLPVDVAALGVDVLTFAGHKGPQGPQGIGGLWAAPHVAFDTADVACAIVPGTPAPETCAPFPGYCDVGSVNVAGAAGLGAGIRWLEGRGSDHARRLANALLNALRDRPHVEIYGGWEVERTAAVSLRLASLALDRAEAAFAAYGIVVRAGRHCAPLALDAIGAPDGTIRISFGPTNADTDMTAALHAIDALG